MSKKELVKDAVYISDKLELISWFLECPQMFDMTYKSGNFSCRTTRSLKTNMREISIVENRCNAALENPVASSEQSGADDKYVVAALMLVTRAQMVKLLMIDEAYIPFVQ
jgi:hypothetical protein